MIVLAAGPLGLYFDKSLSNLHLASSGTHNPELLIDEGSVTVLSGLSLDTFHCCYSHGRRSTQPTGAIRLG